MKLYQFGPLTLSVEQRVLFLGEQIVALTPKNFDLLLLLVENAGRVVSRESLLQAVWGDGFVEDAVISRNISLLRTKLRPYFTGGEIIETISKRGYRLVVTVELCDAKPEDVEVSGIPAQQQVSEPDPLFLDQAVDPASNTLQSVRPARNSRSLWGLAVALVAFALLAVLSYRVYRNEHVYAQQSELAVVDFRDLSGNADASWMGVALQESLSQALSRDGGIPTLGGDQIAVGEEDLGLSHARTLESAELDQLDKRLGVQYVLTGTYLPVGEQLRMDLVLHKGDKVVNEFSETVEQRDLQTAIKRASAQMRASLHLPQAQTGGELQFFGQDQLATHFYAEGLRLSRTGDTPRLAREAFSKAVQADPQFAEAHGALALAWLNLGHEAQSRAEAQLALDTCGSLPETRKLSLQASAYKLAGNYPKSLEALARLRQLHPDDQSYKLRMASTLFGMHKLREATVLLREMEADKTRPPNLAALELLVTLLSQQGDRSAKFIYAEKIMKLARAEGSRSAEAQAHLFAGMGWMSALDGQKAVAEFNQGEKLSAEIGDKVGVITALTDETAARMTFHLPGAIAVGQRGLDLAAEIGRDGSVSSMCINLGSVAVYASQLRSAVSYYKRALDMGEASQDEQTQEVAANGLESAYFFSEDLPDAQKTAALELKLAHEMGSDADVNSGTLQLAEMDSYLGRWSQAESNYEQALAGFRRVGNPPAANDLLVEYAWMELQRGEAARAAELLRTVNLSLLQDNEALAAYVQGSLENAAGDPTHAESVVTKALAKDLIPYRTATGLDVLMQIAVREKDVAKARSVADRYATLSQSIPEDGMVRRGAIRAMAQAEIVAGNRSGESVRKLPEVLREASRLGHTVEVAELQHVLAESRK